MRIAELISSSPSTVRYFFQVLPFTLLVCGIFTYFDMRKSNFRLRWAQLPRSLFVCYLAGLLALVWTPTNFWLAFWNIITRGAPNTKVGALFQFRYHYTFKPSIISYLRGELLAGDWIEIMFLGNFLMFIPMGFFLPFVTDRIRWRNVLLWAIGIVMVIELVQPIVGRSFDIDDVILGSLGILVGFCVGKAICCIFRKIGQRQK